MPDSIQEQIVKKIAVALAPVATVQRVNLSGVNLATLPTILLKEGDVTVEQVDVAFPNIMRRMELFAVAIATQDEVNDTRSGGEILNALAAQIETVLQTNRSWDGLAVQTDPSTYLHIEIDAVTPNLSYGLRFEVVYQHIRTDPYSQ